MGGTELMLIVLAEPPATRLLTASTAPAFWAGKLSAASEMLKLRIGTANVPAVLETTSNELALRLIVLLPPPATIEFAYTAPPFKVSVPETVAVPPLVRASRSDVFTTTTAPVLTRLVLLLLVVTMPLLFTSMVPVVTPLAP